MTFIIKSFINYFDLADQSSVCHDKGLKKSIINRKINSITYNIKLVFKINIFFNSEILLNLL